MRRGQMKRVVLVHGCGLEARLTRDALHPVAHRPVIAALEIGALQASLAELAMA